MLVKIHLYHKSRQVSPFLLPEPHTLFSIKKIPDSFLNCKTWLSQCFFQRLPLPLPAVRSFSSGFFREVFPGRLRSPPACRNYIPRAVCAIVFSISSLSSSGIPLIPTSRKPLMIIPTASSSVSPLAIRYSTWSLAIFPTAAS